MIEAQHCLKFSTTAVQRFRTLGIGFCLQGHSKPKKMLVHSHEIKTNKVVNQI